MLSAARVKCRTAVWTAIAAVHVFLNRKLMPADSAQNGSSAPLETRPHADGMTGESFVAILAGIINTAAGHLDRDDVELGVVMDASCLRVDLHASNLGARLVHKTI